MNGLIEGIGPVNEECKICKTKFKWEMVEHKFKRIYKGTHFCKTKDGSCIHIVTYYKKKKDE